MVRLCGTNCGANTKDLPPESKLNDDETRGCKHQEVGIGRHQLDPLHAAWLAQGARRRRGNAGLRRLDKIVRRAGGLNRLCTSLFAKALPTMYYILVDTALEAMASSAGGSGVGTLGIYRYLLTYLSKGRRTRAPSNVHPNVE